MSDQKNRTPAAKDSGGAPPILITSMLLGFPFLSAMLIYEHIMDGKSPVPMVIMTIILLQNLGLCFYWRRIARSAYKSLTAHVSIAGQWIFMFGYAGGAVQANISGAPVIWLDLLYSGIPILMTFTGIAISLIWARESKGLPGVQTLVLGGAMLAAVGAMLLTAGLFTYNADPSGMVLSAKSAPDGPAEAGLTPIPAEDRRVNQRPPDWQGQQKRRHVAKRSVRETGWAYQGKNGPDRWADLSPEFSRCGTGRSQSPVDINRKSRLARKVSFRYRPTALNLLDDGRTISLLSDKGSLVTVYGRRYSLVEVDFHTPSEHQVNGVSWPMEIHLVHKDASGHVAKISLVEKGKRNKEIDKILNYLPLKRKGRVKRRRHVKINLTKLLPADKRSWHYEGSLTKPPCTEGVNWNILRSPIQLSEDQIKTFRAMYPQNSRPTQPMHDRRIGHSRFAH